MSNADYSTNSRRFHHLTKIQRGQIEVVMRLKIQNVDIAIKEYHA